MPLVRVANVGQFGVNKDLSVHEMPINSWTDCQNIRFLDGYALQFYGHGEVYDTPSVAPQYLMSHNIAGVRYWIYATATKCFAVTLAAGTVTHTDITHATPRAGIVNQWTGTLFGGIPILNTGDTSSVPMYWDSVLANKFVNLTNWPANNYCKSLRSFKNYIISMNMTIGGVNFPYLIKWSHPADPGTLPSTYDVADTTKDAGQFDLAEGSDPIVDGLTLGESFIIYKESSTYRMSLVGGVFIFSNQKIFGMSGVLNKNCVADFDRFHFVVTGSDVVMHDGQSANSVLDKQTRRYFFQSIDTASIDKVFVFKNPFLNEIFVCYPQIGSTVCDKAMVYNFVDKTISFRDLPNINHAAYGPVSNGLAGNWNQDSDPWSSDLTAWNGPEYTPDTARVLMGSSDIKLYMLDASASFDGVIPSAYLERRGLSFDAPETIKLVRGIRPRITGNTGETVTIKIGYADDAYADPTYTTMTHTIGSTIANDCFVSGRYISVWFGTGSAFTWRLDSFDLDIESAGFW